MRKANVYWQVIFQSSFACLGWTAQRRKEAFEDATTTRPDFCFFKTIYISKSQRGNLKVYPDKVLHDFYFLLFFNLDKPVFSWLHILFLVFKWNIYSKHRIYVCAVYWLNYRTKTLVAISQVKIWSRFPYFKSPAYGCCNHKTGSGFDWYRSACPCSAFAVLPPSLCFFFLTDLRTFP